MASTAHKTEEEKREYFDDPDVLEEKIERLAQLVKSSKNFQCFTGAGLSTAAGIPDYRSGANTVIETGPGCWEKLANIQKARKNGVLKAEPIPKNRFNQTIMSAMPTPGHMAISELCRRDICKYVISQNIDGLHLKSGVPESKISELHGNTNLEICDSCGMNQLRDYRVRTATNCKAHKTGRKCSSCGGNLCDSILNFGEYYDEDLLDKAETMGRLADVMLCIGSSLRVGTPADILRDQVQLGGKLIIVNLQKTPLDKKAHMVIHCRI